jgi:D-alanyl-D-alanine carboxypeptidase/D-alanyl-D-alanine-endopeptidase (penicillin-binding protein 4)
MKSAFNNRGFMKKVLFQFLMLLIPTSAVAGGLAERIDGIVNQSSQRKVQFAVNIIRADTGQSVYSFNPTKAMMPASNMKIITSSAAVKFLGADYEFKTFVGMKNNDLVIIGCGDPLLGDKENEAKKGRAACWMIDDIVERLKQNKVTEVGSIIIDTTVFDNQRVHPNWPADDLNKWWACEISGLNFHDNSIEMSVANVSGRAVINYEPQTAFVKVANQVQLISSGTAAVGAYRTPNVPNQITVKGKLKEQEGPFEVAI